MLVRTDAPGAMVPRSFISERKSSASALVTPSGNVIESSDAVTATGLSLRTVIKNDAISPPATVVGPSTNTSMLSEETERPPKKRTTAVASSAIAKNAPAPIKKRVAPDMRFLAAPRRGSGASFQCSGAVGSSTFKRARYSVFNSSVPYTRLRRRSRGLSDVSGSFFLSMLRTSIPPS